MPVKIEDLVEGYWWDKFHGDTRIVELRQHSFDLGKWLFKTMVQEDEQVLSDIDLASLVAPVAPYREKNSLVVIGWLGNKSCYLNVPREESIRRYLEHNYPGTTAADLNDLGGVKEFEFDDHFGAYDIFNPN